MADKPWMVQTDELAWAHLTQTVLGPLGWASEFQRMVLEQFEVECELTRALPRELLEEVVGRVNS